MNVVQALRAMRPAPRLPRGWMDERAERDLADIRTGSDAVVRRAGAARVRRWPVFAINAVVASAVVTAVAVSLFALGVVQPGPALDGQRSPTPGVAPFLFVTPGDFVDARRGPLDSTAPRLTLGVAPNGCITLGDAYLEAPKGSTLSGDTLHLTGIGQAGIGDALYSVDADRVTWTGAPDPYLRGTFSCGTGQYLVLGQAYVGAAPLSVSLTSCPTSLGKATQVVARTPSRTTLLPATVPVYGARVCEYSGSAGQAGHGRQLVEQIALNKTDARALAAAIRQVAIEHVTGLVSCPADFGTVTIIAIGWGRSDPVNLWWDTSGCQGLSNGTLSTSEVTNPSFGTFQTTFGRLTQGR